MLISTINPELPRWQPTEHCFREAFEQRQFFLVYQPQLSLPSRAVYGVEALLRWAHPVQGILGPAQFLAQIRGSKYQFALGEWVLLEALRAAMTWRDAASGLRVSVNIEPAHLLKPGFVDFAQDALSLFPELAEGVLELELLESSPLVIDERTLHVFCRLRARGIRFALDDFGAGFTSMQHVRKLPLDKLKIDKSFVIPMLESAPDFAIVRSLIELGHAMGLEVVAEGVETGAHIEALSQLGCDYIQGYGIARPMPHPELLDWLTEEDSQRLAARPSLPHSLNPDTTVH